MRLEKTSFACLRSMLCMLRKAAKQFVIRHRKSGAQYVALRRRNGPMGQDPSQRLRLVLRMTGVGFTEASYKPNEFTVLCFCSLQPIRHNFRLLRIGHPCFLFSIPIKNSVPDECPGRSFCWGYFSLRSRWRSRLQFPLLQQALLPLLPVRTRPLPPPGPT